MRNKIFSAVLIALFLLPVTAGADMASEQKRISVSANSSSYTVVDLSKATWENIGVQLVGAIGQGVAGSGTTLSLLVAPINAKPTDWQLTSTNGATVFANVDWRVAFSKLNLTTGNSPYVWPVNIGSAQFALIRADAGVTNVNATLNLIGRDGPGWAPPNPIKISEHHSAFGTAGISKFWSGTTSIPVADGCRYVQVQPVGDAVHFTTDGSTTPTTSHTKMAAESVWRLTREEWQNFWMKPAGSAVGTLNIEQWTAKP